MLNKVTEITDNNFQQEVMDDSGVVLIDFYADWCSPCKMLSQTMDQLSGEFNGRAKICKANVESSSGIVSKLGINGVPSLVMFKSGELVDNHVGLRSKQDLINDLTKACNG